MLTGMFPVAYQSPSKGHPIGNSLPVVWEISLPHPHRP
jgi:hypothetical protein